ncbi:MAG TPA: helix-turn-helix domain-containing protein [Streptosporangiaceae bacterium]|nr:helix-turn-helix domain-containing protein [Streptosporangiaceae bacterium]
MNRHVRPRALGADAARHARTRATQSSRSRSARSQEWLTVEQVCDELQVSRRTFDRWRARRNGPRCVRLGGNGPVRIKRCWLEDWIDESDPGTS